MKSQLTIPMVMIFALVFSNMAKAIHQFSKGEGIYLVTNYVPNKVKAKVDGYYVLSENLAISLPIDGVQISFKENSEKIRNDLIGAIQKYCRKQYPEGTVFPGIEIIPAIYETLAGKGIVITGQASRQGWHPISNDGTLIDALKASGTNQFASALNIVIVRSRKFIYCNFSIKEQAETKLEPGDLLIIPCKNFVPEETFWKGKD